jgi:catechol 2,3-dioxygenase-like lactoylglutathione lyase family enzyme
MEYGGSLALSEANVTPLCLSLFVLPLSVLRADTLMPRVGDTLKSITQLREQNVMSDRWYTRPVLFVSDINKSVDFYVKQLQFTESWRYEDEGKAYVAQIERQGCELILSSQWRDKVGKGLMFISLDPSVLDALRADLEGRGVTVKDGQWGYRLMVVTDPDGNELYFPYPADPSLATGTVIRPNPEHAHRLF